MILKPFVAFRLVYFRVKVALVFRPEGNSLCEWAADGIICFKCFFGGTSGGGGMSEQGGKYVCILLLSLSRCVVIRLELAHLDSLASTRP